MNRTITRTVAGVAAGATAFGIVAPAVGAAADASDGGGPNIVDIVLEVSGTEGFDDNAKDYDLLREALLAYCKLDTLAMVMIWREFGRVIETGPV